MKKVVCAFALIVGILAPGVAFGGPVGQVVKAPVKVARKAVGVAGKVAGVPAKVAGKVAKARPVRKVLRGVCGCRSCGC